MSDKRNDGGAAFPVAFPVAEKGLSLRDYFAGQAMIARIQAYVEDWSAKDCYDDADKMLKAREP